MKINKKKTILITFILLITCSVVVYASEPGSQEDPIVTKSYVDEEINKLEEQIENLENSGSSDSSVDSTTDDSNENSSQTFETVEAPAGSTIICGEGTELILRSGFCVAYSDSTDGITNVTTGNDIDNGQVVGLNNLIIIPREGRGVTVTEDSWFLIKGDYEIVTE